MVALNVLAFLCGKHGREPVMRGLEQGCRGAQAEWDFALTGTLDRMDAPSLAKLRLIAYIQPPVSMSTAVREVLEELAPC